MKKARYLISVAIVFLLFFHSAALKNGTFVYAFAAGKAPVPDNMVIKANKVLGQYRTYFGRSSDSRKKNIINAAKKLNMVIVYPEEEFSACKHLTPFTEENGYHLAGTIQEGRLVDSLGGGVCQVASTLYNAVLGAELKVVERHPHSRTVSYVPIGRDAAIAENLKDFRFINNLEVPVLIEAWTNGEYQLVVKIRGVELRNVTRRQVAYESIVLEEIEPSNPIVEYDETKPDTYRKVTQKAHPGYRCVLYKIIVVDGVEIERIKVNESEYMACPEYMTIGAKK